MKAVILAGGFGTRLAEETSIRPKPLVEIGGKPIIWHIMNIFAAHNVTEFVVCLGYKGEMLKEYFAKYYSLASDFTIDLSSNESLYHNAVTTPWKVTLIDTGQTAMTGGRIKAVAPYLNDDEPFLMTYGDGVGDVNITKLIEKHQSHNALATVTAVTPPGRFGVLDIDGDKVNGFREKIASDQYRINAGFFVLDPKCIDYIDGPETVWEDEPIRRLAEDGQLRAFEHQGFWMPMDTLRDKSILEKHWESGTAPWKVWD